MVIVSQLAFYGQTYQNKKWKDMLNHEYSYCLSCLSPLFMAFGVFLRINTLVATCSWFPWYLFVLTLTTQALVTYKGDVTTFGYASWWKMCDVWFALLHSICFAAFVVFPIIGLSTWSSLVSIPLSISLPLGLWYKSRATEALKMKQPEIFFPLHARWHWILLFGSLSSLYLL